MRILRSIYQMIYSIFFRSENFYCKADFGGEVYYKIWEKPGKWCDEEVLKKISDDLWVIAKNSQGEKEVPIYGVLKGEKNDMGKRVITIAYEKKTKKPIGFSAQSYMDVPVGINTIEVLHLGLVYVVRDYQKKSFLGLLYILPSIILLMKRGFRPLWTSNVSQVPAIIGVVADYYQDVYPDPIHNNKQMLLHKSLGNGIMKFYRKVFGVGEEAIYDSEKQIIYNAYTGGSDNLKKTFDECPKYRKDKVNIICKETLNYQRGDDFLQLGILSGSIINNFIKKKMAGISPGYLIMYLAATGLFVAILPVLKWLTRKSQ